MWQFVTKSLHIFLLTWSVHEAETSHRGSFLSQPLRISLVLAVFIHLLRPKRHAAVAVEVETVVSAHVRPLLLQLSVLRLQELRQTRFGPLRPCESKKRKHILHVNNVSGNFGTKNTISVKKKKMVDATIAICLLFEVWFLLIKSFSKNLFMYGWQELLDSNCLPGDQYVSDRCPLHRPISAESEAWLAVDVLRIADVGAIVAFVDGHIYSCSFGVRLNVWKKIRVTNLQCTKRRWFWPEGEFVTKGHREVGMFRSPPINFGRFSWKMRTWSAFANNYLPLLIKNWFLAEAVWCISVPLPLLSCSQPR